MIHYTARGSASSLSDYRAFFQCCLQMHSWWSYILKDYCQRFESHLLAEMRDTVVEPIKMVFFFVSQLWKIKDFDPDVLLLLGVCMHQHCGLWLSWMLWSCYCWVRTSEISGLWHILIYDLTMTSCFYYLWIKECGFICPGGPGVIIQLCVH